MSNCICFDKERYMAMRRRTIVGFDENAPMPGRRDAEPFLLKSQEP